MTNKKLITITLTACLLTISKPAFAGRISGDYSNATDLQKYKDFTNSLPFKKDIGYLFLANTTTGKGGMCSSVEVAPEWVLTSAHCVEDKNSATYFSDGGLIANAVAMISHKDFQPSDLYFQWGCFSFPCQNESPQKAKNDLALIRLDIPIRSNKLNISSSKPTDVFQGVFIGWGDKGDGRTDSLDSVAEKGYITLNKLKTPGLTKEQQAAIFAESYKKDALGGLNSYKLINDAFLSADFDQVNNGLFNIVKSTDFLPGINYEYYSDSGDSGAGLFNYATGQLMGLVAGGGYGNRVLNNGNKYTYAPGAYGSLDFFTPTYLHATWINNIINSNKSTVFKKKTYIPKGTPVKVVTGSVEYGKAASDLELPDSIIAYEAEILDDTYPSDIEIPNSDNNGNGGSTGGNGDPQKVPEGNSIFGLIFVLGVSLIKQVKCTRLKKSKN